MLREDCLWRWFLLDTFNLQSSLLWDAATQIPGQTKFPAPQLWLTLLLACLALLRVLTPPLLVPVASAVIDCHVLGQFRVLKEMASFRKEKLEKVEFWFSANYWLIKENCVLLLGKQMAKLNHRISCWAYSFSLLLKIKKIYIRDPVLCYKMRTTFCPRLGYCISLSK